MLIEIIETHPAAPGKKTAIVVAAGGTRFNVWPEQLNQVQVGRRYEVEVSERQWQGRTLQSLTKITPYSETDGSFMATAAARTNGHAGDNVDMRARQAFVQATLVALIRVGQVGNDKTHLYRTTMMLMQLYDHTLGTAGVEPTDYQSQN